MKKKILNTIIKIAGYIIVLACFIFIYKSFKKIDLSLLINKITPVWVINLILFSLIYSLLFQIQGITWNINLEIIAERKTNLLEILSIYSKANIAKYLPGNIFVFVGRHLILRKYGISDVRLVLINFSEIFFFFGVSFLISLIGIVSGIIKLPSEVINKININLIVIVLIILGIICSIFLIIYNKKVFKEFIKLATVNNFIKISINLFLYILYFLLYGLLNVLIFIVFLKIKVSFDSTLFIIAVFSVSWVLGYVVPGASGGIGVRESILLILLSPFFGYTNTFIVAIISRLITLFGEIFAFFYGNFFIYYINYLSRSKKGLS